MITRIILGLAMIVSLYSTSYAHGTGYRQSSLNAVALEFTYSTGEAMSYREAKVFSPLDDKFAYQTGRTDEEGRFSFVPDAKGEWRVIVRDEEGHQCEAKINVNNVDDDVHAASENLQGMELTVRAVLGVSLMFNIALLIRRRQNAHQ